MSGPDKERIKELVKGALEVMAAVDALVESINPEGPEQMGAAIDIAQYAIHMGILNRELPELDVKTFH